MWCAARGSWQQWDTGVRDTDRQVTDLRIGDAERQATISELTQHYADGRLDASELEQRVEQANEAKVAVDLRQALRDLPRLETPERRRRRRAEGVQGLVRAVVILAAFVAWFALAGVGFLGVMLFFWFGLPALGRALGGPAGRGGPHGRQRSSRFANATS